MTQKKLLTYFTNIVFVLLFVWIVSKADLSVFLNNFHKIGFSGLIFIFFLFLLSYLVKAYRYRYLIKDLSFIQIFVATIYQNFFIFLLPFRLGELAYIKKLNEHRIHWKKSAKDLVFVKLNDILVLSILAGVTFLSVNNSLLKYTYLSFLIIPLVIIGILVSDKFFVFEAMSLKKKIEVFLISILVWLFSFLPWIFILYKFFDLGIFQNIFVIGLVLISTLFPINPPAGVGLVNGVWSLGLILVGVTQDIAINFGIFAYSLSLIQIIVLFFSVQLIESVCFRKNKP